jgi:hypothetical protein
MISVRRISLTLATQSSLNGSDSRSFIPELVFRSRTLYTIIEENESVPHFVDDISSGSPDEIDEVDTMITELERSLRSLTLCAPSADGQDHDSIRESTATTPLPLSKEEPYSTVESETGLCDSNSRGEVDPQVELATMLISCLDIEDHARTPVAPVKLDLLTALIAGLSIEDATHTPSRGIPNNAARVYPLGEELVASGTLDTDGSISLSPTSEDSSASGFSSSQTSFLITNGHTSSAFQCSLDLQPTGSDHAGTSSRFLMLNDSLLLQPTIGSEKPLWEEERSTSVLAGDEDQSKEGIVLPSDPLLKQGLLKDEKPCWVFDAYQRRQRC